MSREKENFDGRVFKILLNEGEDSSGSILMMQCFLLFMAFEFNPKITNKEAWNNTMKELVGVWPLVQ